MANSIFVKGCVPGATGTWVEIRDAYLKRAKMFQQEKDAPPFPTYFPMPGDENVKLLEMPAPAENPLAPLGLELPEQAWEEWKNDYLYAENVVVNSAGEVVQEQIEADVDDE
jgi:hypothetical protein